MRRTLDNFHFDEAGREIKDDASRASRKSKKSRSRRERPPVERGVTDSFFTNDDDVSCSNPNSPRRNRRPRSFEGEMQRNELTRRHSADGDRDLAKRESKRTKSEAYIDMDLAYGELPPPLPVKKSEDQDELRSKMTKLTTLLDEANCLQHSASAIVESLQKNPEALAAVALTLAEISNIASKLAPSVLLSLKGSFPVIIALLASPQFMIAAGVGVGVTVVAFGGYKIIKRIKAKKESEAAAAAAARGEGGLELEELQDGDLSRIELWRRGIAEEQVRSAGTSVDGEFITPGAQSHLVAEGVLSARDDKQSGGEAKKRTSSKSKLNYSKSTKSAKSKMHRFRSSSTSRAKSSKPTDPENEKPKKAKTKTKTKPSSPSIPRSKSMHSPRSRDRSSTFEESGPTAKVDSDAEEEREPVPALPVRPAQLSQSSQPVLPALPSPPLHSPSHFPLSTPLKIEGLPTTTSTTGGIFPGQSQSQSPGPLNEHRRDKDKDNHKEKEREKVKVRINGKENGNGKESGKERSGLRTFFKASA